MPESVSEMPPEVYLPAEIFGDIEDSVLGMYVDGLERTQVTIYDPKKEKLGYSKVVIGNHSDTGVRAAFDNTMRSFFGVKPLLFYHTHPGGIWWFSTHDVASFKGFQRQAYIYCVGSAKGIIAMMQTRENAEMPFRAVALYKKTLKLLEQNEFIEKDNEEMARLIENLGFGYYFWVPGWDVGRGDISGKLRFSRK